MTNLNEWISSNIDKFYKYEKKRNNSMFPGSKIITLGQD